MFPNLHSENFIGVDTETYDPDLKEDGPGWGRKRGYVVGISIATIDGTKYYFPVNHAIDRQYDLPLGKLIAYMQDIVGNPNINKIGANCIYDYGWFIDMGLTPRGMWYDVQFAEALIDGHARSYSLDTLATKYLGLKKTNDELYEWAASKYPGKLQDQGGNIYRCPPTLIAEYAGDDALLVIRILQEQQHILDSYGLSDLFELECKLIPVLVKMRIRGMPVDPIKAEESISELKLSEQIMQQQLDDIAGWHVNVKSSNELAMLYDKFKLNYLRTEKGNPSFTADWLKTQTDPLATKINDIRKVRKAYSEFIQQGILDRLLEDKKIHPSLHPLRGEGGGAGTGRFSSSKPNGQNIPSRDDLLAPIIRGLFIPEEGYTSWLKMDFSQIEYRFFAHFSADKYLCAEYSKPATDFHDLVGTFLGNKYPRRLVKNINFAKLYGAGYNKLLHMLMAGGDISKAEVENFIAVYEKNFPQAKALMVKCAKQAETIGEIRTILNRRLTFPNWAPIGSNTKPALPYKQALKVYGSSIIRADTYKAINYQLQGSAADYIKKGLVDAEEAGLFDKVGYPHITVHDELDFSYHDDLRKEFIELKHVMEHAIPLLVPMIMDTEIGPNWGDLKEVDLNEL